MVYEKIKKILRQKSGISLLFVLAVMMLLMAVGISTLVSASTAIGSGNTAWEQNQLEVYSDSVVKTFTANLQSKVQADFGKAMIDQIVIEAKVMPAPEGTNVKIVYEKEAEKIVKFVGVSLGTDAAINSSFILEFPDGVIVSESEKIIVPGETDPLPRVTTVKGFTMTLTIKTELDKRSIIKQAKYRYSGATYTGELTEEDGLITAEKSTEYGAWEVTRHGKISK